MPRHRSIDYSFGNVIYQLRTSQLCAMLVQMLILYLEYNLMSLIQLIILSAVIVFNVYIVGTRWVYQVDGRYDIQQLITDPDVSSKTQYALELFGGFVLAFLAHVWSPEIESGMSSLCYNLANYTSMCTGLACVGVEVYEGLKNAQH